jgi:C-terminal processing protease CtpA/Prc
VLLYDTLHLSSGITGHLVFESFINPSRDELATAFAYFKANNIKDLILDLRYNGGGYLDISQTLSSYIGGNALAGTVFAKLLYNDKHQDQNYPFPFISTSYSIGLTRMVVITTRGTASASEAVMNGLKPHLTVVSVGDTTNGKPTGMNIWEVAKRFVMVPVTFKIVNSADQGEYFAGIAPAKLAPDDITHDFNDRQEACLKQAISYLQSGAFTTKSYGVFKNSPKLTEKPGWMNNLFLPVK